MLRFPYENDYPYNNDASFTLNFHRKFKTSNLPLISFKTFVTDNVKGMRSTVTNLNFNLKTVCYHTKEFPNPFFSPTKKRFILNCKGRPNIQLDSGSTFYSDLIQFPETGNQILRRKTLKTLKFDF